MNKSLAKMSVVVLVNGDPASAAGVRARQLTRHIADQFNFHIEYRGSDRKRSLLRFLRCLLIRRPDVCYVIDAAYSGVIAAAIAKPFIGRIVIDCGDAISDLARAMGRRGVALALTRALEWIALKMPDHLVVRSRFHRDLLARGGFSVTAIPDGVETADFRPPVVEPKHQDLVIGVLGSLEWSESLQWCYGRELIEAMHLLPADSPVRGVVIGDGSGLSRLRRLCRDYGLEDRLTFAGRVPYETLPALIREWDVCLSTQTNDLPGRVRTTGKLPLYMACGRYVLASRTGEAQRVLPAQMLVDYDGAFDPQYPSKLAARIRELAADRSRLSAGLRNAAIAHEHFEYRRLARRLAWVLRGSSAPGVAETQQEPEPQHKDSPACAV